MKKIISILVCLIMTLTMLMSLSACGSSIEDDWSSVIIGENLPTPLKGKLRSGSNLDNMFSGAIEKADADYYSEYKNACVDMGYTIDSKDSGDRYEAFNADGYELTLYFYESDNEISIDLSVPEELSEIEWPTTGIGSKLPVPASNLAKVTSDSSDCFRVLVGNTSKDDYNNYVKSCEKKGFTVDYLKNESSYSAENSEGYRLNVSYVGCNRIDIMIQSPKEEINTTSSEMTSEINTTSSEITSSKTDTPTDTEEISKDFKEAMDSYEEFFDEYVAFMKKYKDSNGTDLSLLSDYSNYLTKYTNLMKEFEEWEEKELNVAETTYYIQVQSRITQKLLEVAQ